VRLEAKLKADSRQMMLLSMTLSDLELLCFFIFALGSGVFADRHFGKSEFLLEYRGELISGYEGEKRYQIGNSGSFLYFFEVGGRKKMWYVLHTMFYYAAARQHQCDHFYILTYKVSNSQNIYPYQSNYTKVANFNVQIRLF